MLFVVSLPCGFQCLSVVMVIVVIVLVVIILLAIVAIVIVVAVSFTCALHGRIRPSAMSTCATDVGALGINQMAATSSIGLFSVFLLLFVGCLFYFGVLSSLFSVFFYCLLVVCFLLVS